MTGTFSGTLVDGAGVTAQLLMENGFRRVDVEDLVELRDGVNILRNQKTEKDVENGNQHLHG